MDTQTSKTIVLEELRSAFDKIYAASDALDAKLNNLLNFSSLIVSFASTIQIASLADKVGIIFWVLVFIVVVLYLANFYVTMNGLNPREYKFNVRGDDETIKKKYFTATAEQMTRQAIFNCLDSIKIAKEINAYKVRAVTRSYRLVALIVVIFVLAVPAGFLFPAPTLPDLLRQLHGG